MSIAPEVPLPEDGQPDIPIQYAGETPGKLVHSPLWRPDRLATVNAVVDHNASNFYHAGMRSSEFGIHIGVFRKALEVVRFDKAEPDTKALYHDWLERSHYKAAMYREAQETPAVPLGRIVLLREIEDPAVYVMDRLEENRVQHFTNLEHDIKARAKAARAFELILASIHNHTRS